MSLSGTPSGQALEQMAIHLSTLEAKRTKKRQLAEDLFKRMQSMNQQIKAMQQQIKDTENELFQMDNDITTAEKDLLEAARRKKKPVHNSQNSIVLSERKGSPSATQTQADEVLTDPMTFPFTMDPDEHVPDPMTQIQAINDDDYDDDDPDRRNSGFAAAYRPSSRSSSVGPLELTTNNRTMTRRKPPPGQEAMSIHKSPPGQDAMSIHSSPSESETQENNGVQPTVAAASRGRPGTLDSFFTSIPTSSTATAPAPRQSLVNAQETFQQQLQHRQQQQQSNLARQRIDPNAQSQSESFPWSEKVDHLLCNTFQINGFRDHQKEIINATLGGQDVFVIMRTGGGKSLTYQLPALIEGRGPERKVSFVISPLLSLIQDQEEQMNAFEPGSAISFTSSIQGGQAEHARRWDMVRDPKQGMCLVFVTPEKVSKSGKLRSEMEKLFNQGRLGRFVIDECHCACQWGHDFRPDYAQLGILKRHFPSIPVIAVTATASDKVRQDCCTILALGTNYRFFRSTANRLNLLYSVRPKPDGKDAVVDEMVTFIKEKYPQSAGIVYTLSRKDADTVASCLCEYGVVARPYHSDVSPKNKEMVHRSWMRNETQVVVATIAFGLGINKPDVRFVLHHTISKTLDGYYQESGRAGRDGKPADCVLYYSPKVS
jgi:RecQ family ATP-dependent DNA helicase